MAQIIGALPQPLRGLAQLARFDKPIGTWLLLFPAWYSLILAASVLNVNGRHLLWLLGLFWLGALVMRGAGCVINDLWDRDIDKKISRTKTRPLASGIVSIRAALLFLLLLLAVGLLVLWQLPPQAFVVGLAALPLIAIYPLAKRFTGLPQIVLGLTFGWGAFLGWAAYGVWPNAASLLLYIAAVLWIFGYDTIYAIQDMKDDRQSGVKSSALTLGRRLRPVVGIAYGLMIACLLALGVYCNLSGYYFAGIGFAALHLFWQYRRIDLASPESAAAIFLSNRTTGFIITAGLLADYIF